MTRSCAIICLAACLALSGCTTIYNPATEQNEFIFVTAPVERAIGNIVAAKVSKQYKIGRDKEDIERLKSVGKKIADVSDRKDLNYYFVLIEDEGLNAFTIPGGGVYVNSGVLKKSNDDELACVIGHEIGHVAARHIAKRLQVQIGYDILMNIAASKGGLGELQKAASVSFDLISRGYSREDELLADKLGVKYAHKAGYDPYAMISFLEKLKKTKDEDPGVVFLRSHPYISQRINLLKTRVPDIIKDSREKPVATTRPRKEGSVSRDAPKTAAETVGPRRLKVMCPECKRVFSGKMNYCPYDGERLR